MRDCLDQVDLSVTNCLDLFNRSWHLPTVGVGIPYDDIGLCNSGESKKSTGVCVLTPYSLLLTLDVWCRSSYFPFPPPRFLHAMALWAKITSFLTKLIGQGILSHQRQMKLKTVGQSQPFVLLRDSIDWMEINHSVGGNVLYSESSNKKLISSQNSITERLRIIFNWIFGHPGYYSWAELTQD